MKNRNRGFTLAELLIVVAIVGVLVAISVPIFNRHLESSREAVDLSNVRSAYSEVMAAVVSEDDEHAVKVVPLKQKIEVTIPTKYAILRAEVVDDDLYAAIDLVIDKLEDQIRRQKTRIQKKNKTSLAKAFVEQEAYEAEEDIEEVVKTKSIVCKEMSLDEAIMKMELLNHDFFIYTDDETQKIAVVYKRNDGGYGLIETE